MLTQHHTRRRDDRPSFEERRTLCAHREKRRHRNDQPDNLHIRGLTSDLPNFVKSETQIAVALAKVAQSICINIVNTNRVDHIDLFDIKAHDLNPPVVFCIECKRTTTEPEFQQKTDGARHDVIGIRRKIYAISPSPFNDVSCGPNIGAAA